MDTVTLLISIYDMLDNIKTQVASNSFGRASLEALVAVYTESLMTH